MLSPTPVTGIGPAKGKASMFTIWKRGFCAWQAIVAAVAVLGIGAACAAGPALKPGVRVAIAGDSLTEQKLYTKYIETYLLVCRPDLQTHVLQYGWGGDRAPVFQTRMDYDLLPWKPDVTTTCYGLPFQQDLNRLTLKVTGLPTARADVQWGGATRSFTREQLAAGVNLAAEFLDNPFSAPFKQVLDAVAAKQVFETAMVKKQFVAQRKAAAKGEAEKAAALQERTTLLAEQAQKAEAVRALVQPVRYQLAIRPVTDN